MAHNTIDMTGKRYGRMVVIGSPGSDSRGEKSWLCVCDCGNNKITTGYRLRKGLTASCGCLSKELTAERNATHRKSGTPIYGVWNSMIQRCINENSASFENYGRRGISVCKRWMKFENFLEDMGDPPAGHSIDREDNNGNYEPSNCRWSTQDVQANNKRSSRFVEIDGERLTITQHINKLGLCRVTVYKRLASGFSTEEALSRRDYRIEKRHSV